MWSPIHKQKNTNCTNAWQILYMCKKRNIQAAGWGTVWFVVHEHVNIHILLSLLWDLCTHSSVRKFLVRIEESVLLKMCGGGVVHVMFQEVGDLYWVSKRGGVIWVQGSHSLGGKAVEQSGGAGSDALFLMVGAGRDCGKDGLVPQTWHKHFWHVTFLISKKENVGPNYTLIWDIIM